MEIIDNKAILLKLKKPSKITNVIPNSKQVDDHRVLVRWGIDEARVLRNMGVKAPSPIVGRYKWPGKHTPYRHQKETASFLTMNKRAFCLNDMGSGKTSSCIWAADYLMTIGEITKVLIVCPVSIMSQAWAKEVFDVAMHRTYAIAHGTADQRRKVVATNPDFLIINFDGVEVVQKELIENGYELIIIDEANAYKTATTNRWKVMKSLETSIKSKIRKDVWMWMLTGSPAAQSPLDAYGLAKLMNPQSVPSSFSRFRDMVMFKISQFKWVPKESATQTVHNVLQPAIRFTKEECLDLPEMVYLKREVPLSKQQDKYYKELKNHMRMAASGETVTASNAAVSINKLLQVSAGCIYSDDGEVMEFDIKPRFKVLMEVVEQTEQKVLVFANYKHVITKLVELLSEAGISADFIRGDVASTRRGEIIKRFQDTPDPRILVLQPQAAAHGITLTAADTVVWWGPTPSLEIYAQGNARVHRPGQKHKCSVVQLQGSPAEAHFYSLLDNKIDIHTKILDLYKDLID